MSVGVDAPSTRRERREIDTGNKRATRQVPAQNRGCLRRPPDCFEVELTAQSDSKVPLYRLSLQSSTLIP